jgi:Protein of unknown function (DUF4236)
MGRFRFYRRVRLFPGLTLNVSRSGPSLSVGIRGAHVTVGKRGVTRTVGIPGSGIFYTSRTGHYTGVHSAHRETARVSRDTRPVGVAWLLGTILLWLSVGVVVALVIAAVLDAR